MGGVEWGWLAGLGKEATRLRFDVIPVGRTNCEMCDSS
jgi:hypothetical protein